MKSNLVALALGVATAVAALWSASIPVQAQQEPNIVFIMGDDVGWFNIGAYHRGMMAGRTPNLDKLAAEGMLFTDYYAEASCTAGRANFITGQLPIRTGLTTVGQAGSPIGMPAAGADHRHGAQVAWAMPRASSARTTWATSTSSCPPSTASTSSSATSITSTRWKTRRIRNYPPELKDKVGPRNMVHSWATDQDDPTVQPRWGKVGKQKIEDAGTLYPEADGDGGRRDPRPHLQVHRQGEGGRKPFFLWLNPTRMHVVTHLSDKYEGMRNAGERLVASTRPAWPSSTTSSARS